MTSSKKVTLNTFRHVPDIRKNLVPASLLRKNGFKLVFVSDKFVLTKNEMYVGNGYLSNKLFKINVMTVVPKSIINYIDNVFRIPLFDWEREQWRVFTSLFDNIKICSSQQDILAWSFCSNGRFYERC